MGRQRICEDVQCSKNRIKELESLIRPIAHEAKRILPNFESVTEAGARKYIINLGCEFNLTFLRAIAKALNES